MTTAHATVGEEFAKHLLAKDWESISTLLAPDVDFRGLTPARQWQASDAKTAIDDVFKNWFEPGDEIYEVVDIASDGVVDRERVVYRARIRNSEGDFVCEQTAYYDTDNGRITKLRVLCSGFLPAAGRTSPSSVRLHPDVTVSLRRPTTDEFAAWSAVALEEYIDEIAASGGMSREAAATKARSEDAETLPDGLDTPRQLIFRVEADGQPVGWLWLALDKPVPEGGVGYIYDISVDEPFRGRGYGRAAMRLAEEEARRNGLHALALNVFGHNTVARRLYASLGYRETSVQMRREL